MTVVRLRAHDDDQGRAKCLRGVARCKKLHDKRQTGREREWSREKGRLPKERG